MRTRGVLLGVLVAVLVVVLAGFVVLQARDVGSGSGQRAQPGLYVDGNRLTDAAGNTVVLHGVNRSGGEYACIDGWGFFDGPTDQGSVDALRSWGINTVRLPLNSACWLDLQDQFGTYNAAYAGQAYQDAVASYVQLLTDNGLYVVLDLQWSGCGSAPCKANDLKPMPDRPHATAFWSSVATRFKDDRSVLFDLFNEPRDVDWACWRDGGCTAGDPAFTVEGMQPMVDAVRAAGAKTQPILLGGLSYANDMRQWSSHLPTDPSRSLVASVHAYTVSYPCPGMVAKDAAGAIACFTDPDLNPLAGIARTHPVVFGELGQDGCATDFVTPMLEWIQQQGYGVLGWAWNVADCSSFPSLISDYAGTPTAFGEAFQRFFMTSRPGVASEGTSDQIVSRGRPAFSSVGLAGAGSDDSYATTWDVPAGQSGWLAFDLSSVPESERRSVVLSWYTALDDGYTTGQMAGGCPIWSGRPFLGDYVVEVNAATGGGEPPEDGWRQVAAVAGNVHLSGQHLVDLHGAPWIRIRGGGPNGSAINVDVADASSGERRGWLFAGDSITAAYAGHPAIADATGGSVASIAELVAATSGGRFQPLQQNGGVPCSKASDAVAWLGELLDGFHGRYVTLNFGTNDGWDGQGDPQAYYETMVALVEQVTARGLVPVVPTIPCPNNPGAWDDHIQAFNDQIRRLYDEHPEVVPGPDVYSLLAGHPELFKGPGDVHPNEAGSAAIRAAWADTIVALLSRS